MQTLRNELVNLGALMLMFSFVFAFGAWLYSISF